MMKRRLEVLGALAMGCAAGWILCWATSCSSASATTTATATCDPKSGYAVQTYAGMADSDIAERVTAFAPYGAPDTTSAPGQALTGEQVLVQVGNGVAIAQCKGVGTVAPLGTTVQFTLH